MRENAGTERPARRGRPLREALGPRVVGDVALIAGPAYGLVNQLELLLKRLGELQCRGEVVYASIDHAVMKQFVYPCKIRLTAC